MAPSPDSRTAYLGLGSNLGDRLALLRSAVSALQGHPHMSIDSPDAIASLFETAPLVSGLLQDDQPLFLNSAVRVETTLAPHDLLRATLEIEAALGRTRRKKWEARTIDIDLLLYDDVVINGQNLTLPHPRMHERRFVLEPLAEIAGDVLHPTLHATISRLTRELCENGKGGELTRLSDANWIADALLAP